MAVFSKSKPRQRQRPNRYRKSEVILLLLILSMFLAQTIYNITITYILWFAFIKHGDTPEDTLSVLELNRPEQTVFILAALLTFLRAFKVGVADAIMVSSFT